MIEEKLLDVGLGAASKVGKGIWNQFFKGSGLPKETVKIVTEFGQCWWHKGSVNGKPAMQIEYRGYATNIISKKVMILGAHIEKPKTHGMILVRHPDRDIYGGYPLLPDHTIPISLSFWIRKVLKKEAEDFKANIIVIDQLDNKHRIKNVVFRAPNP